MTCIQIRELLPEFAVGVLSDEDREGVLRHLRWCAGCRKEAEELGAAAATVAFALPPEPVPEGLGDRVVGLVRQATGAPGSSRRVRVTAALALAGLVTVSGLGWGAVMAGRADRFADRAAVAESRRTAALEQFQRVLSRLPGPAPQTQETFLGQLVPQAPEAQGGGAALELVSPTRLDLLIVMVSGLDPADTEALPYRVTLANDAGHALRVGQITELDADGSSDVLRQFDHTDLTGYTLVTVTSARGDVALVGRVDQTPASPAP